MASPYVALTDDAVVIRPLDEMDCDWTVVGQLGGTEAKPVVEYHPTELIFGIGKIILLSDLMYLLRLRGPLPLRDERTTNANTT